MLGRKREAEEEEAEVDEREGLRETERECLLGCEWPLLLLAERPREREGDASTTPRPRTSGQCQPVGREGVNLSTRTEGSAKAVYFHRSSFLFLFSFHYLC